MERWHSSVTMKSKVSMGIAGVVFYGVGQRGEAGASVAADRSSCSSSRSFSTSME